MGLKNLSSPLILKQVFHLFTITLLSLLLPLSFLLLARLSCFSYVLSAIASNLNSPSNFLLSFYFYTNPAILYLLVSVISIATLFHGLTGKITLISESPDQHQAVYYYRPRLCIAWMILCILQVSVGSGIKGSIELGIDGAGFGVDEQRSLLSRVIFFLGLHEIMLLWSRTIVKPVIDDAIFGAAKTERWFHRTAVALSVGTLWWWKLRDEVESMVVVAEAKKELSMKIEMADFISWWLYYLTVTIGMVRVVKAFLWLGAVLVCRRVRRNTDDETSSEEDGEDNKV